MTIFVPCQLHLALKATSICYTFQSILFHGRSRLRDDWKMILYFFKCYYYYWPRCALIFFLGKDVGGRCCCVSYIIKAEQGDNASMLHPDVKNVWH